MDLGFGIWDLGFGIWDLGFGIWEKTPFSELGYKKSEKYSKILSRTLSNGNNFGFFSKCSISLLKFLSPFFNHGFEY